MVFVEHVSLYPTHSEMEMSLIESITARQKSARLLAMHSYRMIMPIQGSFNSCYQPIYSLQKWKSQFIIYNS